MSDRADDLPNPLDALRAGVKLGELTDRDRADLEGLTAVEQRLARRRGVGGAAPTRVRVDLERFARLAGMPLAEVLAQPDPPRPVYHDNPWARALGASRVPALNAEIIIGRGVDLTAPAVVRVLEWLAAPDQWLLVLSGRPSRGKTTAACYALARAGGGLFVTTEEVVSPDGLPLLQAATAAPFLVLDEMGEEALTEVGLTRLRRLLSERYSQKRRTVATTNMNLRGEDGWAKRYGERQAERFLERGSFFGVIGPNLRTGAPA